MTFFARTFGARTSYVRVTRYRRDPPHPFDMKLHTSPCCPLQGVSGPLKGGPYQLEFTCAIPTVPSMIARSHETVDLRAADRRASSPALPRRRHRGMSAIRRVCPPILLGAGCRVRI